MSATVLHVSDLHRDAGSAITTTTLLESLRLDSVRYIADDPALAPDLAVVSGDIVYGVSADDSDADTRLRQQYDEALGFLVELTNLFLEAIENV